MKGSIDELLGHVEPRFEAQVRAAYDRDMKLLKDMGIEVKGFDWDTDVCEPSGTGIYFTTMPGVELITDMIYIIMIGGQEWHIISDERVRPTYVGYNDDPFIEVQTGIEDKEFTKLEDLIGAINTAQSKQRRQ